MNFYALPPLFTGVLAAFFGLVVLSSNPRSKVNGPFAYLCLSAAWWLASFAGMYLSPNELIAQVWARIGFIGIAFIPVFALQFSAAFVEFKLPRWIFSSLFCLSGIGSIIGLLTSRVYTGVTQYFWGYYPEAGQLYLVFSVYFFIIFAVAVWLLALNYFQARKQGRPLLARQSFFLLLAFASTLLGIADFLPNYQASAYPIGYISTLIFMAIVIYATAKVRLLDVDLAVKRNTIYYLLSTLLTGGLVSLILIGVKYIKVTTNYGSLWVGIVAAFIIAVLFQPLRNAIERVIDNLLFRQRYSYQLVLSKYINAIAKPEVDLERFSRLFPYLLTKEMFLSAASTMVLDRDKQAYVVRAGEREAASSIGTEIAGDSPLVEELLTRRREIILEEVQALVKVRGKDHPNERLRLQAIIDEMKKLNATLIIPSISESGYFNKPMLLSTINLGKKFNQEAFSRDDIEFLTTLAHQITMNIEYAFIFEELKKNQAFCVQAEKLAALGTATAGVAHELKNPFTYLYTVVHAMPKRWDDPEFKESVLKMLPSEVERIKLILEGLSDYSKMNNLNQEPTLLAPVIEKVLAILGYEIKRNNVKIEKQYAIDSPIMAMVDKNRIVQVFMNILTNAIQAIGSKGGTITISILPDSGSSHVVFKDTGPGIPPKVLKRIFDPFFTTKETGTGLGLSITKKILEDQSGSVKFNSVEGQGTTVTITLPSA